MVRSDLERLPEFCAYRPDDYYRPWVSIEAASYLMFERLMKIADGNIPRAVGMYNVGPKGSSKLAEGYFLAVADRYRDTFVQGLSYSPTRYFMLNMAQKDYFAQIESDFLFVHTAAGSTRG
jgi:hypothetical protein